MKSSSSDNPWTEVRPNIWLNKDTALFHFEDETANFSEEGYLTPDEAKKAMRKYCLEVLGP